MKVRNKKPLLAAIVILTLLNTINYGVLYICSGIFYSLSHNLIGKDVVFWLVFDIIYPLCLITSPIISTICILINKRTPALLATGAFYAIETIYYIYYLFISQNFRFLFCLIVSLVPVISFCLFAVKKINSIVALATCAPIPVLIIISKLWTIVSTALYSSAHLGEKCLDDILFLSIYALTICVVCYYIDPKEKPRNAITSTYFDYKNIAISITLSIVTFGIYTVVWLVDVARNTHKLHGVNKTVTGEVLLILFIPFYSWYWFYTRGKQMFEESRRVGGNMPDYSVLYLVLAIFGLGLINLAVMQNCFNKYAVGVAVPQTQPQINSDIGSRLKELQGLANQGLITPEEYESKRKDILNKL